MKRVFFVFLISVFLPAAVYAETTIRVLITDGQFKAPQANENIKLVDQTMGKLLISHDKPFSGKIEVWKGSGGLYLVNEMPLEEYLKSVVKAETGTDWAMEALKAQAVVSRTYALYQKEQNEHSNYDITSSTLNQVYEGDIDDEKVSEAVKATAGEVLTYKGKLIQAFFHSTSVGETEDPVEVFGKSLPYLKPVKVKSDLSPYASWARRFSVQEIEAALNMEGIKDIRLKSRTVTGRVRELEIDTDKGVTVVKATDFRRMMGWRKLPSTAFDFEFKDGYMDMEGSGYGHGVGMCQWSALEMARSGKTYKEILSYFYPGTSLVLYGNQGI